MIRARLIKQLKLSRVRKLHSTLIKNEDKTVSGTSKTSEPVKQLDQRTLEKKILGSPMHTVSNFDKRILVWVKRYPSMDQVPKEVSIECIARAHTQARIRTCYILMAISIVGFIVSTMMGKRDVAAGKNILTERLKWQQEVREKGRKEKEAAAALEAAGKA